MKARINPIDLMSNRQQRVLRQKVEELAAESVRKTEAGSVRRWMKLLMLALNEEFGFGASRLCRILSTIDRLTEEEKNDPVFWIHADMRLKQLGMDIPEEGKESR